MNTGCPDCDKIQADTGCCGMLCSKHHLEYLGWCIDEAITAYEEARKEYERKQNEQGRCTKTA